MSDTPVAGQVTSSASNSVISDGDGHILIRKPHCESCGFPLRAIYEDDHLVAYYCVQHGPLTHDAIVWVYESEDP